MRRRKKDERKSPAASGSDRQAKARAADATAGQKADAEAVVKVSGWMETEVKAHRKAFPDPRRIDEPIRIAMTAKASAEIIGHAKESLDAEVCGVLLGELCEDQQGVWVWVQAAIRGTSTEQGGAHVTYTQETWDKIHEVKDRDYPKLSIVGWYHSHPGFGVEFSDMDMFIQENFFAGPAQFALVLDPLSGDEAICANAPDGIRHVSRFWVNGRQRTCRLPSTGPPAPDEAAGEASGAVAERLKTLEERLQQVLQATDEDRMARHHVHLTVGMLAAMAIVLWISFMIYDRVFPSRTPPKGYQWTTIPIQLPDGKVARLGAKVVSWELPPDVYRSFLEDIIKQVEAEEKKRRKEQEKVKAKEKPKEKRETEQPPKAKPNRAKGDAKP